MNIIWKEKYNLISNLVGDQELNKYIGKLPANMKNDENKSGFFLNLIEWLENEISDESNEDELEDMELLKILNVIKILLITNK